MLRQDAHSFSLSLSLSLSFPLTCLPPRPPRSHIALFCPARQRRKKDKSSSTKGDSGTQSRGDTSSESKGNIPSLEGGSFSKDESIIRTLRTMEESVPRMTLTESFGRESAATTSSFILGRSTLGSASGTSSFVQKYVKNEQSAGQGSSPPNPSAASKTADCKQKNPLAQHRRSFTSSSLRSRKEREKLRDNKAGSTSSGGSSNNRRGSRGTSRLLAPLDLSLTKLKGGQQGSRSFVYFSKRFDTGEHKNHHSGSHSLIYNRMQRRRSREGVYRYVSRSIKGEKDVRTDAGECVSCSSSFFCFPRSHFLTHSLSVLLFSFCLFFFRFPFLPHNFILNPPFFFLFIFVCSCTL